MAASKLPNQTLSEELEDLKCSICMESFKEPKNLPCLHNFCKQCLADYIKSKGNQQSFLCPICRQNTNLPLGGVDALITNFLIVNLQDAIGTNRIKKQCEICSLEGKQVTATGRCINCRDYLCQECTNGHTRSKQTHNHHIIPIADLTKSDIQTELRLSQEVKCEIHPEEQLKYYCQQDKKPVCRDCIVLDHRDHKFQSLKETADSSRKILREHTEHVQNILENYRTNKETILNYRAEFQNMSQQVEQEIKSWTTLTCKKVREFQKRLLAEFHSKTNVEAASIQNIHCENDRKLETLETTLAEGNRLIKHGKDAEIILQESQVSERMIQIEKERIIAPLKTKTTITFQPNKLDIGGKVLLDSSVPYNPQRVLIQPGKPQETMQTPTSTNTTRQSTSTVTTKTKPTKQLTSQPTHTITMPNQPQPAIPTMATPQRFTATRQPKPTTATNHQPHRSTLASLRRPRLVTPSHTSIMPRQSTSRHTTPNTTKSKVSQRTPQFTAPTMAIPRQPRLVTPTHTSTMPGQSTAQHTTSNTTKATQQTPQKKKTPRQPKLKAAPTPTIPSQSPPNQQIYNFSPTTFFGQKRDQSSLYSTQEIPPFKSGAASTQQRAKRGLQDGDNDLVPSKKCK